MTDAPPPGHWVYGLREIDDEDGDHTYWTSYSIFTHEPFTSAQEAYDFGQPWIGEFEVIRKWVPETPWEPVPETEWKRP